MLFFQINLTKNKKSLLLFFRVGNERGWIEINWQNCDTHLLTISIYLLLFNDPTFLSTALIIIRLCT